MTSLNGRPSEFGGSPTALDYFSLIKYEPLPLPIHFLQNVFFSEINKSLSRSPLKWFQDITWFSCGSKNGCECAYVKMYYEIEHRSIVICSTRIHVLFIYFTSCLMLISI